MATQVAKPEQINPALVVKEGKTFFLKPSDIQVTPEYNPRRFAPPAKKIQNMYDSLLDVGQIQPVGIRPSGNDKDTRPQLAFGFTRYIAAQKMSEDGVGDGPDGTFLLECQWEASISDADAFMRAGRENNDRNEMTRVDRAFFIDRCKVEFGMSQQEVSKALALSPATVSQDLKLLKLIPKIQRMVHDNKMAADAAIEISDKNPEEQEEILVLLREKGKGGEPGGTKSDTQEASGEQEAQSGTEPTKAKPKTMKVLSKNIRQHYSMEALEKEGWQKEDAQAIADFWASIVSFGDGTALKGKRKVTEFKDIIKLFYKTQCE